MKLPGVDLGINIAKEVGEFKALLTSIVAKLDTLIDIEQAKTADQTISSVRWPENDEPDAATIREGYWHP